MAVGMYGCRLYGCRAVWLQAVWLLGCTAVGCRAVGRKELQIETKDWHFNEDEMAGAGNRGGRSGQQKSLVLLRHFGIIENI